MFVGLGRPVLELATRLLAGRKKNLELERYPPSFPNICGFHRKRSSRVIKGLKSSSNSKPIINAGRREGRGGFYSCV